MGMVAASSKAEVLRAWSDELRQRQGVGGEAGRGQRHDRVARLETLDPRADGRDLAGALAAQGAGIAGIQIEHVEHVAEVQPRGTHPNFHLSGAGLLTGRAGQVDVIELAAGSDFQR